MRLLFPAATAIALLGLVPSLATGASQTVTPTLSEAIKALPDPNLYRVELAPSDMPPEQAETLAQMMGDAAAGQHFYGAVYGYRPLEGERTEYTMRSGLHSRAAARQGALEDCQAARGAEDSECVLAGEILPEDWTEAMPELSHVAVEALQATADALPGNVVVARSEHGDGFEIRSGDDVADATLGACNAANADAGLPEDCAIVIRDAGAGD